MTKKKSILKRWSISESDLTDLVDQNPSLRGIFLGYAAEKKFHDMFLNDPAISEVGKDDDHNRKLKGDRRFLYKGHPVTVEVKSLQTNQVKKLGPDQWTGGAQVDASDSRLVTLPNGSEIKTTCLLRGEFDILAVNCFAFGDEWRFAFALNEDLPQNTFKKYTPYQQKHLLPTLIRVEWPLKAPFVSDPKILLEKITRSKRSTKRK